MRSLDKQLQGRRVHIQKYVTISDGDLSPQLVFAKSVQVLFIWIEMKMKSKALLFTIEHLAHSM